MTSPVQRSRLAKRAVFFAVPALALAMAAAAHGGGKPLSAMGLEELEARAAKIEGELGRLALEKLLGGIGSVGFETYLHDGPDHAEWVEVDWGKPVPIDQIVLVPVVWRLGNGGVGADGFPPEFRVLAGTGGDRKGTVVAEFTEKDGHLPRSAPLVVPCRTEASWVRVEAARLSQRTYDRHFNMQLSELMVFSGGENVALKQRVESSSTGREEGGRRSRAQLTDGFLPFEMSVPNAESSGAFMTTHLPGEEPELVFDLGRPTPVGGIHLHPIESSNTFPADVPTEFGVPDHFAVEGANRPDFSDAVALAERHRSSPFDAGPIFMFAFPEGEYRFVRVRALLPNTNPKVLGFSEVGIFSRGENVAQGKPVAFPEGVPGINRGSLNDGLNRYGRILPLKEWMGELARRHDLEKELPLVRQEIQLRYSKQKKWQAALAWTAGLAVAAGVLGVLVVQILRMRQVAEMRTRFAADLHDELGANLHSIGLLAGMARGEAGDQGKLGGILGEIERMVASTGAAAKYCIEKQIHPSRHDLPTEMRKTSARILADIEWGLECRGAEHLQGLKPAFLDDLLLFYKECLVNISRHSKATRVRASLEAGPKHIQLEVADNGQGIPGAPPPSLQRRARLLGGKIAANPAEGGGTAISLTLRPRR